MRYSENSERHWKPEGLITDHAKTLDVSTTRSTGSELPTSYPFQVFSGTELGKHTEVVDALAQMLFQQPANRFHRRYPDFKFHEEPTIRRLRDYEKIKRQFIADELQQLTFMPDAIVALVYDNNHNIAVFAEAYPMDDMGEKYEIGIIRNASSRSSGPVSLTAFGLHLIYSTCLQNQSIHEVVAKVHRDNEPSHQAIYAELENLEQIGYKVGWEDGTPSSDPKFGVKTGKHWRAYQVAKVDNKS